LTAEDELDAEIDAELLRGDAPFEIRGNYKRQQVSECWRSHVKTEGDLGFEVPNGHSTPDELHTAYTAFLQSVGLLKAWRAALRSIEDEKK
jgi:hypothetical protein